MKSNPKQSSMFYIAKEVGEDLKAWFGKGKKGGAGGGGWDRYNSKGERIGKCGDSKKGEGKPKCLSKSKAASLRAKGGKKAIAKAVNKKRKRRVVVGFVKKTCRLEQLDRMSVWVQRHT